MSQFMSKEEGQQQSAARLAQMREAGITHVEIIGGGSDEDYCPACLTLKGQRLDIEFATPLPLPGCDKKQCFCIYLAIR